MNSEVVHMLRKVPYFCTKQILYQSVLKEYQLLTGAQCEHYALLWQARATASLT